MPPDLAKHMQCWCGEVNSLLSYTATGHMAARILAVNLNIEKGGRLVCLRPGEHKDDSAEWLLGSMAALICSVDGGGGGACADDSLAPDRHLAPYNRSRCTPVCRL
ncbi:hypothetical protein EYF80_051947 [Liparis tanakae]|uniref:Uncharacterized protein n=1 Tax=Liparis tanakae TaxID=230148 RepID=A0A4Z2FAB5_9TELE|nr:hypothetical protein EYF80_051947 [Liparis tanakae]